MIPDFPIGLQGGFREFSGKRGIQAEQMDSSAKRILTKAAICGTIKQTKNRGVAQLVARDVWDVDAAGSNPVTPTKIAVLTAVEAAGETLRHFFVWRKYEKDSY